MKNLVVFLLLLFLSTMIFADEKKEKEKAESEKARKRIIHQDSKEDSAKKEKEKKEQKTPEGMILYKEKKTEKAADEKGGKADKNIAGKDKKKKKKPKKFVKGELANVGAVEIISPYNSIGVRTGVVDIDQVYYLSIDPNVNLNRGDVKMGFHLPFRLEVFNTSDVMGDSGQFSIRKEDWDELDDYLRIVKYITYGRSEDNLYVAVGANYAQSIGHGTIMKRFIPSSDISNPIISGKLNYYNDYGGFEATFGDLHVTSAPSVMGALAFIKPLSFFGFNDYGSKSLSFGYTFVTDRNAPKELGYISYPDVPMEPPYLRIDSDEYWHPIVNKEELIAAQGVDVEYKVYKDEFVDIKTYLDYSWLSSGDQLSSFDSIGGGLSLGVLGRFNLDKARNHAMRGEVIYRMYDDSYIPSFFDMFYHIERYEMLTNILGVDDFKPDGRSKYKHLEESSKGDTLHSVYSEFSYSYKDQLALSLGIEKLSETFSMYYHLELPDLYILKGMFSYYQRGIKSFKSVIDGSNISSIFRGILRIELLPVLYINAYTGKRWTFWPDYKMHKDDLQGHFLSSYEWGLNIEVGYEF